MTLLFPKKEPLRYKMREVADEILKNVITLEVFHRPNPAGFGPGEKVKQKDLIFDIGKNLEVINAYFKIAKWQNWVSYFDVLKIEEEYDRIKSKTKIKGKELETKTEERRLDIKRETISLEESVPGVEEVEKPLGQSVSQSKRQITSDLRREKILEFLKEKEKAQVGEVNKIFPEVTKRTLRRDFVQLLEQGVIERIGERNSTFYRLKKEEV